ncbi:hypothetical protein D5R93_12580 [Actinomyces lilanjuaniae]|uniref:ATP-dependent DNA helicase RecG C-terminal domain-containing protein n=1 Tax=Actinomyces lilanjuaniae TaxID=2321394 RepID=A0ABN5PQF8_9ACTO|nr:hypothetical protein [Actinomyces lilanjuaniae]AYD90628.1 hypothetical protein D5R93_12580 [Actinomyces lilanjuaniae]
MNVLAGTGEATVAGLYALGTYPQQHLPHLSLTAAVDLGNATDSTRRAMNRKDFTGPLPTILDGATEWVAQNVSSTLVVSTDGRSGTEFSIRLVAVREVVANALVHRDLSDATAGRAVELRLTDKGMVLTSPGGLWGLSVDQLGTPEGKSAVNEFLYGICRHIGGRDHRVIEATARSIGDPGAHITPRTASPLPPGDPHSGRLSRHGQSPSQHAAHAALNLGAGERRLAHPPTGTQRRSCRSQAGAAGPTAAAFCMATATCIGSAEDTARYRHRFSLARRLGSTVH